jgi:RND family efflux transporter MFP subunit
MRRWGAGGRLSSTVASLNAALTIVASAAMLSAAIGCKSKNGAELPPPTVEISRPLRQSVTDYLDFTGNTAATNSVTLVARVEGYLEKIHFADGARVRKGDLLFTIQQDQYQAQLQQAEAQVQAQQAALWHARRELARFTGLLKEDAATQTEVDHWQYQKDSATAALLSAQAQVTLAKLNLSYTLVAAPFDGRMGRHLVDPGNLVGTMGQQTSLAEIDRIDPIYVYFTINERDLLRILAQRKADSSRPISERELPAYFALLNEKGYPHVGYLDFASISVSPTTGTLQLRAIFPNHDLTVLPGLFVRVRMPAQQERAAL